MLYLLLDTVNATEQKDKIAWTHIFNYKSHYRTFEQGQQVQLKAVEQLINWLCGEIVFSTAAFKVRNELWTSAVNQTNLNLKKCKHLLFRDKWAITSLSAD